MKLIVIDCLNFTDKLSAHSEIASSMHLPEYYGRNLDALWDMLTQITGETTIILSHSDKADAATMPIIELFREAAEENKRIELVII